jgi:hypothetical protein
LLSFVAEQRFVLTAHVQALLGISVSGANRRLSSLRGAGLLSADPGTYRLRSHAISRRGLAAIGSDLPQPRGDSSVYWHDVGVAWLWLAARAGTFGPLAEIVSERGMRSSDGRAAPTAETFGVRLGGFGAAGQARLHYPDLLLRTRAGHNVAIELERSHKKRARREAILGGYALDRRIDAVVYFVDNPATGRAIEASAARLGLSSLVHVQRLAWDPKICPPGRGVSTERSRPAERAGAGHAPEAGL